MISKKIIVYDDPRQFLCSENRHRRRSPKVAFSDRNSSFFNMSASLRLSVSIFFTICAIGAVGETSICDSKGNLYNYVDGTCIYVHHELGAGGNAKYAEAGCRGLSTEYPGFNYTWHPPMLDSEEKIGALINVLKEATTEKFSKDKVWFWIGLRREDVQPVNVAATWKDLSKWRWTFDNSTLRNDSYMKWPEMDSSDETPEETCVLAHFSTTDGAEMKWYGFDCDEKRANLLVCQWIPEIATTTTTTTTTTSTVTTTIMTTTTTETTTPTISSAETHISPSDGPAPTAATTQFSKSKPQTTPPSSMVASTAPAPPKTSTTDKTGSNELANEQLSTETSPEDSTGMWIEIGIGLAVIVIGAVVGVVFYVRHRRRGRKRRTPTYARSMYSARSEDSGRYENFKPYKQLSPASRARNKRERELERQQAFRKCRRRRRGVTRRPSAICEVEDERCERNEMFHDTVRAE